MVSTTTDIVAPLALALAGVALLFAVNAKAGPVMFKCRVCGIELPDHKNYGLNGPNTGGVWQDGFCKRCMFAVKDGRVGLIA